MVFFSFLIIAWVIVLAIIIWDLIQKGQDKPARRLPPDRGSNPGVYRPLLGVA